MSLSSATVDVIKLRLIGRSGTAEGAGGIILAEIQLSAASAMTRMDRMRAASVCEADQPPMTAPSRIAANVALSISALPAGSSFTSRCTGSTPYLMGPNSAAMMPYPASATNSNDTDCMRKPSAAMAAMAIS
jgi:hypothetical protein